MAVDEDCGCRLMARALLRVPFCLVALLFAPAFAFGSIGVSHPVRPQCMPHRGMGETSDAGKASGLPCHALQGRLDAPEGRKMHGFGGCCDFFHVLSMRRKIFFINLLCYGFGPRWGRRRGFVKNLTPQYLLS